MLGVVDHSKEGGLGSVVQHEEAHRGHRECGSRCDPDDFPVFRQPVVDPDEFLGCPILVHQPVGQDIRHIQHDIGDHTPTMKRIFQQ